MVAATLSIAERQVARTLDLLEGGATIPFISRYRKEMTGGLDEVQIGEIKRVYDKLVETGKRKETILASIEAQDKLTDELKRRIEACWDATELEDIYLPYKPKRRTRAEIARQKGLEPLAVIIAMQREAHIREVAGRYVNGQVRMRTRLWPGLRIFWPNSSTRTNVVGTPCANSSAVEPSSVPKW